MRVSMFDIMNWNQVERKGPYSPSQRKILSISNSFGVGEQGMHNGSFYYVMIFKFIENKNEISLVLVKTEQGQG